MEIDLYALVDAFNTMPAWQLLAFTGALGYLIGDFGYAKFLRREARR